MATKAKKSRLPKSVLVKKQARQFRRELANGDVLIVTVRHDDACGNGHNTFTITGDLYGKTRRSNEPRVENSKGKGRWLYACGCLHDEVVKYFPKLAPLLKWHLCSTDGPMHYVSNTLYAANDKDCWGYRRGEQKRDKGGKLMWMLPTDETLPSILCADEQPESKGIKYVPVLGEGKEPDLEAARRSAIWPDATLEQLQSKEALEARLPVLMREFKKDVESLGLVY